LEIKKSEKSDELADKPTRGESRQKQGRSADMADGNSEYL